MQRWALISLVGLALASHARAQATLPLTLRWRAPEECAQAAEVRAELERITRVRAGFTLTPLVAEAEVERSAQGYATRLRTERQGERGERRLEASDCRTLVRAVTLVLALAFGAGLELTEAQPPTQAPTRPSTGERSAAQLDGDTAGDRAPRRLELAALVGGGVELGPLPAPSFAVMAGAQLARGAFALELRASALPALSQSVRPGVHAHFDGLGGAALACGQLPRGPLTLALCAGARAAALRGRSSGAADDDSAIAPWYALATAAALGWPNTGLLRLRLEAALSLSLGRPRFVIDGLALAHRVPWLAPALSLLLVVAP